MAIKKDLGIYIHIPFCISKCIYCDFLSMPMNREARIAYTEALVLEIMEYAKAHGEEYRVKSVFFGGGTPSILETDLFTRILKAIKDNFRLNTDCEITVECNPGTTDADKFKVYQSLGVNRLSFGLQSVNDDELKALGRIHTYDMFLNSYELAIKSGFNNINVDIMSALPNQTVESWRRTLSEVTRLNTTHISAYSLIVEEGTPLFSLVESGKVKVPDEDTDREIYSITNDFLAKAGFKHYEISNYAKSGFECKHNIIYWQRGDYEGFGLGASSFTNGRRYSNTRDFEKYIKGGFRTKENIEIVEDNDAMAEYMYLGMRMMDGVRISRFAQEFGIKLETKYGSIIKKYTNMGFIETKGDYVRLTDTGIDVSNVIFSEFLD